jgi:DNA-binding IclR family transcriptional regulator
MAANVQKVSVAIGKRELSWAKRQARRAGTSVSAVLTAAARAALEAEQERALRDAAWAEFVEWSTGGKGVAPDDLEAARRELGAE